MNKDQKNAKSERLEAATNSFLEALGNYKEESESKENTISTLQKQIQKLKQELELKNAGLTHGPFNPESVRTIDEYNIEGFEEQLVRNYWTQLVHGFENYLDDFLKNSKEWKFVFENVKKNESKKNQVIFLKFMKDSYAHWEENHHDILCKNVVLHLLSKQYSFRFLKIVFDNGFDFNCYEGNKFINWACEYGKTEVIELLLPKALLGDINLNGVHELTLAEYRVGLGGGICLDPFSIACLNDRHKIMKIFLKNAKLFGIELSKEYECRDSGIDKGTILYLATRRAHIDTVKLILEASKELGEVYGAVDSVKHVLRCFDVNLLQLYISYSKIFPSLIQSILCAVEGVWDARIVLQKSNINTSTKINGDFPNPFLKEGKIINDIIENFKLSLNQGNAIKTESDASPSDQNGSITNVNAEIKTETLDIDEDLRVKFEEGNQQKRMKRS